MTAVADLDRETQDRYELVVKATDMAGQMGGLSGSTTVTIVITDVNDNPPRFPQSKHPPLNTQTHTPAICALKKEPVGDIGGEEKMAKKKESKRLKRSGRKGRKETHKRLG